MTQPGESDSPTPVVYYVSAPIAAELIDAAIALGAPLEEGARSGEDWQIAIAYLRGVVRIEVERRQLRDEWRQQQA